MPWSHIIRNRGGNGNDTHGSKPDQQVYKIPQDPVARIRLAASMGFADPGLFIRHIE